MSRNLYEIFAEHVRRTPEKRAVVFHDRVLTYEAFDRQVNALAFHLHRMGVAKGSHVAVFAKNSIEFAVVMMSCAFLGATIVPLPLTLKGAHRNRALERTDCTFVIGWHTVVEQLKSSETFAPERMMAIGRPVDGCRLYDDLPDTDGTFEPDYAVSADTNYILTMTSGSTGDPKPIVFSQQTKIDRSLAATRDFYNLTDDEVVLASTPMYHSLAQRSVLLPLLTGGTSVILDLFTPERWVDAVEKHRVTFLFAVSTQLEQLSEYLQLRDTPADISSLKIIVSSSALLREPVKKKLLQTFACDIHECYGTSEVGVVTDLLIREKAGSVGKALPFVDLKIAGNEIVCKSLTEFKGYYRQPDTTRQAYDDEGYFHTGDIGELDEEGYLYYRGRLKDVIVTGAVNVYPRDIEELINTFDEVDECAVIGIEDAHFGEAVVALMTEKEGHTIDIKKIRRHCLQNLTDYQMPKYFDIVDTFPKSGLGKIIKSKIDWKP